jgi:hypothetical protein
MNRQQGYAACHQPPGTIDYAANLASSGLQEYQRYGQHRHREHSAKLHFAYGHTSSLLFLFYWTKARLPFAIVCGGKITKNMVNDEGKVQKNVQIRRIYTLNSVFFHTIVCFCTLNSVRSPYLCIRKQANND